MAAVSDVPQELIVKPLGFVAVTGLDIVNNAIHSAIWDAFNASRRQDKALNIKPVVGDYECPRRRQKRTSYEFYVPKGILKRDWMSKHLQVVPSLMVIFFDLDWDNAQWKEKETECASKVAVLRSSLQGRNTKLAVVLIQKNIPLPPGEDVQAIERAASLCSACELSSKSLFVLPFSGHLHGYVTRLENAFYEIAQGYYINETRRVKAHREFLNKSQHQLLYVRHQFKIAFFSELKQDVHTALKHYKQAYVHILEIKQTDVNNLEVKTVAGFINYKICRLCFKVSAPLDAISQFRKHIDYFKTRTGITDLSFEHCAWMGKQFSLFGDLFQEAVKNGLQAIQTQHPGFYYQQAALYSVLRRKDCSRLCRYSEPINPDPLEKADFLEYFGQRPWRQGCQANEPPDPGMEQAGIMSLQAQELTVDHSGIIIPFLSSAVAQFREYKSVRLTLSLMVQMGEEYYHAKDHTKALTLLNRVTVYYRSERWWALLTSILVTGLRCAYFTASVIDYVTFALELVSKHSEIEVDEKKRILKNLLRLVEGEAPESEIASEDYLDHSEQNSWKDVNLKSNDVISVPMESLASFLECRAAFDADSFHADEQVTLTVYLRSTALLPVRISDLSVVFSNQAYNQVTFSASPDEESSDSKHDQSVLLYSEKVKAIGFQFTPLPSDISNKIEIKQIGLHLGPNVVAKWTGAGLDANCQGLEFQNLGNERTSVTCNRAGEIQWDSAEVHPFADLVPRTSEISLNLLHDPPSFVGEFYQIVVELVNKEEYEVTNVRINVSLKLEEEEESSCRILKEIPTGDEDKPSDTLELSFEVEKMDPGEKVSYCVYIHSLSEKEERIQGQVEYDIRVPCGKSEEWVVCRCGKEQTSVLPVMSPIAVNFKLLNQQFESVDKVHSLEPFLLFCKLVNAQSWQIVITSAHLELNEKIRIKSGEQNQLADTEISDSNEATECHCLVSTAIAQQSEHISMGEYVIRWKRTDCKLSTPAVETRVALPGILLEQIPFYIESRVPAFGCVQRVLPVSYKLYNRTDLVQEVEVEVEPSDSFLFSGNSQVQFRILPGGSHLLCYNMYPVNSGKVKLPRLHLNLPRYLNKNMDVLAQKMLPTSVFITPMELNSDSIE